MAKWPLGEADRGICRSATWIARRRNERGIYRETKLGLADDLQDANGDTILDFAQAQRKARTWWTHEQQLASGGGAGERPRSPASIDCFRWKGGAGRIAN